MKRYFSIPLHALIGLVVFFIAANAARFAAYGAQNWYRGYYWKKAQAEYERPFREDKIGGQTPEQTWEMFISALEQEDIEKASGYFHVTTREKEKSVLLDKQNSSALKTYLSEIKNNFSKSTKSTLYDGDVMYTYKIYKEAGPSTVEYPDGRTEIKNFPAGEYEGSIEFVKNVNNIWKLYSL